MTEARPSPLFSVIVATRNRAALFAIALRSVLDQSFQDLEIVVVNDGSSEEEMAGYRDVLAPVADKVRLLTLVRAERGHGQSYALNFGAAHANGAYLCFLDDDDQWTDPGHLRRAAGAIAAKGNATPGEATPGEATNDGQPDLVLSNQKAFLNGTPVDRVVWIEDLTDRLTGTPGAAGAYTVTAADLLACQAHCHLNTMIVSRAFWQAIGGMDEGLRYECDRDVYLRAIDQARSIEYLPNVVSRHNIPDPAAGTSMSTAESDLSKRLYQLRVMDKAVLFSTRPEMRRYAMRQRLYALDHLAAAAARANRPEAAAYYRREALLAKLAQAWSKTAGRLTGRS